MAAPALQKTWQGGSSAGGTQFVNVVVTGIAVKDTLWAIKNAMVNQFANPWTVIGSSDGANASMDGTDRWIDNGDIIYPNTAGNPFSWIVLQQTAIGATFQTILYANDILTADPQREHARMYSNSGGFGTVNGGSTNGSTTILPDVADTDKSFGINGEDFCGAENGSNTQKVLTCISSTDGECFRAIVSQQSTGIPINGFGIEVPRDAPAWWSPQAPAIMYCWKSTVASALSCFRWETMYNASIRASIPYYDGGFKPWSSLHAFLPIFSTVEVVDLQEDDRPNPMLYPIRVWGGEYGNAELNWGSLFDWYWCSRNVAGKHLLDLDTIPVGGDRTFVCVGDNVIGWLDDSATDLSYT